MRRLRTLVLQLTLVEGVEPRLCWDPRGPESFPLPKLEHLTLSHPSAGDGVYKHLPHHIRVLDLSCYPHLAERPWLRATVRATVREYGFPIIASSDTLNILQQCRAQAPLELHLEYRADERETDLLQFFDSDFPQLQGLQLDRYRALGDDGTEVSVSARENWLYGRAMSFNHWPRWKTSVA
ncbi:hypothetical protein K466DRAFT_59449 [Polyporus arcularius HHB13444]|uniref:F-box domain-containing protein n=1 Tax=Polyporus arcularius HHB13444 TaxID=1314778 RepID=A0A5C3PWF1_9APHY|nr:hypothetical protein K466DRAFT_59449 [Polyporus arcularius HHB13444]